MNRTKLTILCRIASRKLAVLLLVTVSVAAFATLGDGKSKPSAKKKNLLSSKSVYNQGTFSLKSGYDFRGSQVLTTENETKYIRLHTDVTLQKGKTTYTVPLKKKVILDNVKIDIGNRQFQRN
jgi:hypothetical protein